MGNLTWKCINPCVKIISKIETLITDTLRSIFFVLKYTVNFCLRDDDRKK